MMTWLSMNLDISSSEKSNSPRMSLPFSPISGAAYAGAPEPMGMRVCRMG